VRRHRHRNTCEAQAREGISAGSVQVQESMRLWCTIQGSAMQLHSANDQMTAHVNMAFSRPQNYDSLHRVASQHLQMGHGV